MKNRVKALSLIAVLITGLFLYRPVSVRAFSGSASLSAPGGKLNQQETFTAVLSINADEPFIVQGNVSVSGGLAITGMAIDGGSVSGNTFLVTDYGAARTSYQVNIGLQAIGQGGQTISVEGIKMASLNGDGVVTQASASVTIKTDEELQAEREASIAASVSEAEEASRRAQEEASRQAIEEAIRASEAERQASIAASESAYNASVAASAASVEASRKESEAYEQSVAASLAELTRESVEKESRSIEESLREEAEASASASLEEYEASVKESESEYEEYLESVEEEKKASIEASRASYESSLAAFRDDLTRASEYEGVVSVKKQMGIQTFYFASEDTNVLVPEGFEKTKLLMKKQPVLAFTSENLDPDLLLVYGMMEGTDNYGFYYYDTVTGSLMSYDKMMAAENEERSIPEEEKVLAGMNGVKDEFSRAAQAGILAFILGVGITALVYTVIRMRKAQEESAK